MAIPRLLRHLNVLLMVGMELSARLIMPPVDGESSSLSWSLFSKQFEPFVQVTATMITLIRITCQRSFLIKSNDCRCILRFQFPESLLQSRQPVFLRTFSDDKQKSTSLTESTTDAKPLTTTQKVVAGTKVGVHIFGVVAGFGMLVLLIGAVVFDLFSPDSQFAIYSKTMVMLQNHPKVRAALGEPITGYGSESNARFARHNLKVNNEMADDGTIRVRMKFRLRGPNGAATVYLRIRNKEIKPWFGQKWEYEQLYLMFDHKSIREILIIENNPKGPPSFELPSVQSPAVDQTDAKSF